MRKLVFMAFVLVLFSETTLAQNKNNSEVSSKFSQVDSVKNVSKAELYTKAKLWLAKAFKSSKDVIQFDDKEAGKIIVKGVSTYDAPAFNPGTNFSGFFSFTLTIDIKDNKFRFSIENLNHESYKSGYSGGSFDNEKPDCGNLMMPKRSWKTIREEGQSRIITLWKSFQQGMKASNKDSDDW